MEIFYLLASKVGQCIALYKFANRRKGLSIPKSCPIFLNYSVVFSACQWPRQNNPLHCYLDVLTQLKASVSWSPQLRSAPLDPGVDCVVPPPTGSKLKHAE